MKATLRVNDALCTYLVILDGEENETVGVFLENRLIDLWGLGGDYGLLVLLDVLGHVGLEFCCIGASLVHDLVLFVGGTEVKLLDRRLHVQVSNSRSSLLRQTNVRNQLGISTSTVGNASVMVRLPLT